MFVRWNPEVDPEPTPQRREVRVYCVMARHCKLKRPFQGRTQRCTRAGTEVTAQSGVPSLEFGGIGPYFPGGYVVPVIEWGQYNVRFYCPAKMRDGDYCKVVESFFQKPFPKKDEIGSMLCHMTRFDGGRKYVRDTWLVPPWVTPDETYPKTHGKFHSYNILLLMHGNGTIDEEHFSRFMMKLDGQDLIVPKALERFL